MIDRERIVTSVLPPHLFLIRDNPRMDAPSAPPGKSARLRHWLARHLVAMIAVAIVLATLGWKNQYQFQFGEGGAEWTIWSAYGWPCNYVDRTDSGPLVIPRGGLSQCTTVYIFNGWQPLLLDASIAIMSLIATWVLFSRTQRRCERWWQLSLSSLFGFVMLAAVVCTVLNSESLWGW